MWSSKLRVTPHRQTRSLPGAGKAEGRDGSRQYGDDMIGLAGTVDLPVVTSTSGYRERHQWGGREGASIALFDQWLNACE